MDKKKIKATNALLLTGCKHYFSVFKLTSLVGVMCVSSAFAESVNSTGVLPEINVVQQNGKITGTVVDQTGTPVIGANVMVKGTTNGTITDMDGKFTLDVDKGATLIVSYIGFTSQEIKVGNQTKLSIELKEDSQALDELVVVGYGTMKKADLTGSVATVDSEVLEDRPITNLGSGLQGAIANLNISSSNGAPGTGASFNIRGTTNLSGSGP